MPIVTFTSDFGLQDYYLPMIKGAILKLQPGLQIIDITHNIDIHDIVQAAFAVKNVYASFPSGSIHLVSVNNYYRKNRCFIAARHENHYFIGPDNGIFSLLFDPIPQAIYELEFKKKSNFPLRDVFANAVAHIADGRPLTEIGLPLDDIEHRISFQPVIGPDRIQGTVIYVDNYENVIVNITKALFSKVAKKRKFQLFYKSNDPLFKLYEDYCDVPVGERLCFFNSAGYLEIAINMGKAASMLDLKLEDTIQIDFID